MKNKFGGFSSNLKYKIAEGFNNNKKCCFILFLVALIGILTGVFTAINYCNGQTLINFNDFSLCKYLSGELGTLELFFSRFLSYAIVMAIVLVTSCSVFVVPINFFLLAYRGYLLSLNVSIMIILYGVGGIMTGIFIILPCHLLCLLLIAAFMCMSNEKAFMKKRYGVCKEKIFGKFIIILVALTVINIIETFLLYIFSSKVILVI